MSLQKVEQSVFETILARRSVRSYTSKLVEADILRTLLEAAVRAPTAMHKEPWAFVIIQNEETMQKLSDRAKPLFIEEIKRNGGETHVSSDPDVSIFYDASTLIIICCKTNGHFSEADCWLAAQNMMLAACAMELGTCVVGSALLAISIPEIKSSLGIPNEFTPVAPIIIGYPSGETAPSTRKAPLILNKLSMTVN